MIQAALTPLMDAGTSAYGEPFAMSSARPGSLYCRSARTGRRPGRKSEAAGA
jgi:hypothetical protein